MEIEMRKMILGCLLALWLAVLAGCVTQPILPPVVESPRPEVPADEQAFRERPARPFKFQEITLDNGLRVLTMEDFSSPIVAVQVWYHVGSKDENPNRQGFAHMFEHMMFRGTELLGPEEHFNLIRGVGGDTNAFTYFDYTAYVNSVPANQLDLALWLEAERMMFLDVTEEGFETERDVVKEERRELNLNAPYGTLPERVLPVICTVHPYRWTPIGRIAHLEAARIEELEHFWDIHYVPGNATLVIVGAVWHEQAQEAARTYFGWMPKLPDPPKVTIQEPPQTKERKVTLRERLGPIPAAGYVYRTVAQSHPDSIPLEMTLRILSRGDSSRFHSDLVKKRKLCALIMSQDFTLEQDGLVAVVGALHPVKYILGRLNPLGFILRKLHIVKGHHAAILQAFDQHIEALQRDGVTEHELAKVKNQMMKAVVGRLLTVRGKAQKLGEAAMFYPDPEWVNRELYAITTVTKEDIQRIAQTYLVPERRTSVNVVPDRRYKYDPNAGLDLEDYALPEREFSKTGIVRPESFPTTPPIDELLDELPEVSTEETILPNGLKVVAIPNDEVPIATVVLGLRHGAWTEDPKRPGVASMTLSMLTKGTERHTAEELADIIEFNALDLYGAASLGPALVAAGGLSEKLPTAMKLLAEVVRQPTFPGSELRILKKTRQVELMYQEKEPSYRAATELRRRVFGDHPYARDATGQRKDVRRIRRRHLVEWWNTFARPDAAVLYVAGDVTAESAFALAERHFGDWTAEGPLPEIEVPPLPERQETHIYLVNNPRAAQSEIRVGQTGFAIHHADRRKALIFNQVFGGSFSSRLNKAVRVERGLTYGAGGGFSAARYGGIFACSTSTKTESTSEALEAILDVIESMRGTPPSDEELTSAKSYLVGRVPARYETALDTVNALWRIESNDLAKDDLTRSVAEYRLAEIDDVLRIANEHVDLDRLTIVVVGDAKKIKRDLEATAPVTVVR
jgi:zinc protease